MVKVRITYDPGSPQTTVNVAGKPVAIHAESQEDLDAGIRDIVAQLDQSFAPGEVPDNLHIDFGIPLARGDEVMAGRSVVDQHGNPHLLINSDGAPRFANHTTILHEMVHAQQHNEGRASDHVDTEEIETELEALARTPYATLKEIIDYFEEIQKPGCMGYWCWYFEVLGDRSALQHMIRDREIITGSLERHLTGSDVRRRVQQVYHQTWLAHMGRIFAIHRRYPIIPPSQRRQPRYTATVSHRATKLKTGKVRRVFVVRTKRGDRTVTVDADRQIAVATVAKSLRKGLCATAVWVCKNCRKVKVV